MRTLREGSKGQDVRELQAGLNRAFGERLILDGHFGPKTEQAVRRIQRRARELDIEVEGQRVVIDGVAGPQVYALLWDLTKGNVVSWMALTPWQRELLGEGVDLSEAESPQDHEEDSEVDDLYEGWDKVPVDAWKRRGSKSGGYGTLTLRGEAAGALESLRDKLHAKGAIVTSSGGRRRLGVPGGGGRALLSNHKTGDAFDLYLYSMGVDPRTDPYVFIKDKQGRRMFWRLFARAERGSVMTLDAFTYRCETVRVTDRFVDFTEMAKVVGFDRIPARNGWRSKKAGRFEAWHYQYTHDNIVNHTTYGYALQRVWTLDRLEGTAEWKRRHAKWTGYGWR